MESQLTVILRIVLYAIAGRLTAGGWLPTGFAEDPAFIEAIAGVTMGLLTAIWWKLAQWRGWAT